MKNVTITLGDDIHRKARIRAAELGTSLSALVKQYLEGLVSGTEPAPSSPPSELGDMHMAYKIQQGPNAVAGPPWFVDGQWLYTKDGKPRQPGALRGTVHMADDFDETPEWLIDAMEGKDSDLPWPK